MGYIRTQYGHIFSFAASTRHGSTRGLPVTDCAPKGEPRQLDLCREIRLHVTSNGLGGVWLRSKGRPAAFSSKRTHASNTPRSPVGPFRTNGSNHSVCNLTDLLRRGLRPRNASAARSSRTWRARRYGCPMTPHARGERTRSHSSGAFRGRTIRSNHVSEQRFTRNLIITR